MNDKIRRWMTTLCESRQHRIDAFKENHIKTALARYFKVKKELVTLKFMESLRNHKFEMLDYRQTSTIEVRVDGNVILKFYPKKDSITAEHFTGVSSK